MDAWWQQAGWWMSIGLVGLLCLAGLFLSCLSISGTWLVIAASLLAAFLPGLSFPGWLTFMIFLLLAILVEVVEWLAASWGVTRRGGSVAAGWAALLGGLAGLFLGSFIPIPLLGNLLGMCAGSFALVYVVERARLKRAGPAVQIALGAVAARLGVILVKVLVTLGMMAWLLARFFTHAPAGPAG